MTEIVDVTTIRALNDRFRQSLRGGMLVMTAGVIALGQERQLKILEAVARFDSFDEDNDPYGEHDFGALEVEGERLFFKIDYYDQSLSAHSPDPCRRDGHQARPDHHAGGGVLMGTRQHRYDPELAPALAVRSRDPAAPRAAVGGAPGGQCQITPLFCHFGD